MQKRKDHKGRVLKDGETYRKNDGLYMYRWIGGDKKRHAVYCSTLEGLREKEKEIQNDLRDGIQQGSSNITLNDVYKMWKNDKVGLKQTTRNNYIYMYEHFVMNDFGNRKIKEIRKSDVRRYYNGIVDSKKMSVATLESIHTVLHQVFILAVEDGYIRINPSDLVLGDVKRSHNFETPKRHALTIPQQEAFVSYINKSEKYKHWLPLFTFFLGTGCRVSEVVGLRWEDVHMDENYIEINHNMVYYQRDKGKCYFSVTSPKTTAGYRIIPMLPEVKQALLNEKKYQEEVGLICQASIDGYTDFIFLNRNGFAHNPQTINRTIKRITLACSGARVIAGINDLATLEPLLEKQWSEKNKIKPTEVSIGSHKKVIWRCEKGHEWEAAVKSRTINKTGCPYCSHNKVLAGFNDLATLLPDIAAEWSDRNYPTLPTVVVKH